MIPTDIVATKSFGDLVITTTALTTMPARSVGRLLIGDHLVPLAKALSVSIPTVVIAHGEGGVPAIYDVRRCGTLAALRSAWHLRRLIHAAQPQALLFDQVGMRERWLAGRVSTNALPAAENIYIAYSRAFGGAIASPLPLIRANDVVGIFPGSRLVSKNLPELVVRAAIDAITGAGLTPRLMLLEGERPDLERSGLQHEIVPRSFAAMIDAVATCGLVVSADSMPAHIAENQSIPIFVLSPVDNRYWLPFSAFVANRWALFADNIPARLDHFLRASKRGLHESVP